MNDSIGGWSRACWRTEWESNLTTCRCACGYALRRHLPSVLKSGPRPMGAAAVTYALVIVAPSCPLAITVRCKRRS